ncbi:hypothetical protein pipiens_010098 [Culex pipiens pipiens]|uniref:Uncharacterized protein n=1 Tax=Culex pipiens pipiens TaxID=38569 RepID=A0ABD1DEU8_CULPP
MAKKSKKKAPAKAKTVKAPAKPVPVEVPPPRVSFRPAKPSTRKSSVIMLSSAENSLCSEPSLILNEPSISIIDLARPSTRMSMEMDMTDLSDPRFSTRSPAGDDTDLSLTNIVQTPGVYRERPKSSWVMRRTRSKSMVPAPTVLEDVPEEVGERLSRNRATQSGEFSKVTRRARSVRPPARYLESIDENAVTKRAKNSRKKQVVGQEVESSLPMVTPAKVTTRRRNVAKDKIAEEVPIVPEVTQSSTVSTRRRNKPVQPDENHNHSEKEPETAATSVSQTTSEEDSNKSLETVSMVSVRRRRAIERPPSPEYPPEEPVFTQEPEPVEKRPLSPEYPSEEPVFTQEPEPAPVVRSRGRQRRAVERMPSPEPVDAPRPRTRSASREPILQQAPESASRPKRATKKVSKCPCCVNGQTHQESSPPAPKARGRSRTRSEQPPVAQEKPAPKIRAARSKSVMREPAPKTPPARSKSVSRESLSHVPVYRQQVAAPIEPAAVTAAKKQDREDQDVYAFDSPGLLGQSYEQLKVTSEMSNKLITAMRKYKTTVHNQSVASISASGELPEDERLIAKFHEQQLSHSIKTIEQVSAVPKTLAQRQVLDNFRRDSKVFLTMINEIESAMNDSNVENVSPRKVAPSDKPAFKDVVILTERNLANRNRSPLKTLEIANVPARFSPIKSPLVRSSFSAFASSKNLNKPALHAIEIADTFAEPSIAPTEEQHPKKDLFGFETDDAEEATDPAPSAATPIKITKKTLKERLESVRKMLPPRPPSRGAFSTASLTRREPRMPKVIDGPSSSKPRSVQSVFASSTPVAKQKRPQTTRRGQLTEPDADLSAIADEPAQPAEQPIAPSPPVALFDDVASTTLSAVNRTYSRIPRRNHKRKRNVYLADLGLSDDDEEEEEENVAVQRHHNVDESEPEGDDGAAGKQAKKKRRVAASKKKKKNGVEETNEFKQFVNEFNSMCEEVDRYKLVIEKPAGGVRQRV